MSGIPKIPKNQKNTFFGLGREERREHHGFTAGNYVVFLLFSGFCS